MTSGIAEQPPGALSGLWEYRMTSGITRNVAPTTPRKEKMDRKDKNKLNTTKSNATPIKTSGTNTAELENPNTGEAEHILTITLGEC